jgi:hypothetical protein
MDLLLPLLLMLLLLPLLHHTNIGCHFITNPSSIQCSHTMLPYHDDQCMNPILYTDNCCCLDPLVASELQTLLTSYEYSTPMSTSVECDIGTSPQLHITSIDQSRQVIRIGTVRSANNLIHIWMVRPTIDFSNYIIRHDPHTGIYERGH